MKCRLTRITDNDHTRTREMIGESASPPVIGRSFVIVNDEPLDRSGGETMRMIETSPVQFVMNKDGNPKTIRFMTLNTTYDYEEI